jgi:excisionase family DNA binding protein
VARGVEDNMQEEMDVLMTCKELGELLGLKPATIHSMVHRGQLPHFRVGKRIVRFSRARIMQWLEARTVEPNARHACDSVARRRAP